MIQRITILFKFYFAAMLLILVCAPQTSAQSFQMPPVKSSFVSLEVMKPNFDQDQGVKTISSVWYLSGQFPTSNKKLVVITEFPLAYYDDEGFFSPFVGKVDFDSEFLVGNPLIALEIRKEESTLGGYGIIGTRLPLVGDGKLSAAAYGIFTDFDRFEAFLPNSLSLLIGGGHRIKLGTNTRLHIGGIGLGVIPTEKGPETEIFFKYFSQFWIEATKISLNIGFTGSAIITQGGLSLAERTEHQLSLGVQAKLGTLRPGAFIRAPIAEDLNNLIDYVAGVNLTVLLGD